MQESLRRVGWLSSGLNWREDEHLLFNSARSWGIYKFQLAGKWSESEKISCHAILENPYEPKMDVILTISLKITAKNQDKKTCFASYFADEVYRLCKAHNVCVVVQIWSLVWIFLNQFKFFKLVWIFQTS